MTSMYARRKQEFEEYYPYIPAIIVDCVDFTQEPDYSDAINETRYEYDADKLTPILLLLGMRQYANRTPEFCIPDNGDACVTVSGFWPESLNDYLRRQHYENKQCKIG